jgi:WD40 repeat protein
MELFQQSFGFTHGHCSQVRSISVLPPNSLLVTGSEDKTVRIWDLSTNTQISGYAHSNLVLCTAISLDGEFIFSGSSDRTIISFRLSSSKIESVFKGHNHGVSSLVLIDRTTLISASWDSTIKIWDLALKALAKNINAHNKPINAMLRLASNLLVSAGDDCCVKIWNISEGMQVTAYRKQETRINCLAVGKEGKFLFAGSGDPTGIDNGVCLWNLEEKTCGQIFQQFTAPIQKLLVSDNDSLLFIGSKNVVYIGNIEEKTIINTIQTKCMAVAFSNVSNTEVMINFTANCALFYNFELGKERKLEFPGHFNAVNGTFVNNRKNLLITCSGNSNTFPQDHTIRIWNPETRTQELVIMGLISGISCCDIDFSTNTMAICNKGKLYFWSKVKAEHIQEHGSHSCDLFSVCISKCNRFILTIDANLKILVWLIS